MKRTTERRFAQLRSSVAARRAAGPRRVADSRPVWQLVAPTLVVLLASCGSPSLSVQETEGASTDSSLELEREPLGDVELLAERTSSALVTIRVAFDAGSAEDLPGQEGVTALAADLMVEGGAGELSYAEVTERLFPMAGELSAYTSRDQTVFSGRVHRDHLEDFYRLFRSALFEPQLTQSDFERLRSRARSGIELELRGNNDEQLGKEALQAMLYEGHPYAHPPTGTISALEALTVEDVAAQRGRVFCGGRAIVGVMGGYPEGFAERVRDDIVTLTGPECVGRRVLAEPTLAGPRVWLVEKEDATAVAVSMGMPINVVRGDEDYPALVLAAAYLGQHRTFAGRLMNEMRGERGLNYGDYAYIEHFDQDSWSAMPRPNVARRQQYVSIWIRPVRVEQAHFAIRMAVKELHEFAENGLSREDFERIRGYVQGYYALYLQTESRQLGYAIDDSYYGQDQSWSEMLQTRWAELTVDEVNEAIRRHVDPTNLQIAIVHPEGAAFADELAAGTPSPIEYAADAPTEVLEEDRTIVPYPVGIARERMKVVPVEQLWD